MSSPTETIGASVPVVGSGTASRSQHNVLVVSLARFFLCAVAVITILLSIAVIDSCRFFSYHDTANFINNSSFSYGSTVKPTATVNVTYFGEFGEEPSLKKKEIRINKGELSEIEYSADDVDNLPLPVFEELSSADVGLFSYSIRDSSESCVPYKKHRDWKMLIKNNAWTGARFCSVFAPILSSIAMMQLIVEWLCGWRLPRYGSVFTGVLFLIAGALQFGTLAVVYAPQISDIDGNEEYSLCFSAESTIQCKLGEGAWYSVGSAVAYIILAVSYARIRNATQFSKEGEAIDTTCSSVCHRVNDTVMKVRTKAHKPSLVADTSSDSSNFVSSSNDNKSQQKTRGNSSNNNSNNNQDGQHRLRQARDAHGESNLANDYGFTDRESETTINFGSSILSLESEILFRVHSGEVERGNEGKNRRIEDLEAGEIVSKQSGLTEESNDSDGDNSIIKDVPSIETELVRPSSACCYCTEPDAKRTPKRKNTKKKNTSELLKMETKKWRANMTSMLSEDDAQEDDGIETEERLKTLHDASGEITFHDTGATIEECEAQFMAELEGVEMEHTNWENSIWKKGFDFVRS